MKKKCCESCKHWRYKSDDGQGRCFGICEHPESKMSIVSEPFLRRFLPVDVEDWIINEILKSQRTEGTFLCNQYEKREQ